MKTIKISMQGTLETIKYCLLAMWHGWRLKSVKRIPHHTEYTLELLYLAISGYIGEKCRYCQHVYKSVDDIAARNVVYVGERQYACKVCFDTANPANIACS